VDNWSVLWKILYFLSLAHPARNGQAFRVTTLQFRFNYATGEVVKERRKRYPLGMGQRRKHALLF
jgi:hypothetical protein